jgi:CheY-like chemotaxis protein
MKFEVLIVDDDPIVILLHEKMVTASGSHSNPICFSSGILALDYILTNKDPDKKYFILLDINMPEMSGWDFLDEIIDYPVSSQVVVAVVTSSTNESDKRRAFNYKPVTEYIAKPLNVSILHQLSRKRELSAFFIHAEDPAGY